jgi:hypothetical protein
MMVSTPPRRGIGRRVLLGASAALGLGLVPASPHSAAARQVFSSLTLLIRGEATLTGAPMAWRVVRDVAETSPDAAFERRALGFTVATNPFASLLLTDKATGSASRLDPGEAAFVREGTFQRRESLGTDAQSYLRIALMVERARFNDGGDRLIFAGSPFAPPNGLVRLELLRAGVQPETALPLPRTTGEVLVLVEQGELFLERGESDAREILRTVIGSDTSNAVRSVGGAATLHGSREATSVLIATIE